jgi:hypothetical protein
MAPNTNVKAVALFGVSAKDLELIGAGPSPKALLIHNAPQPSTPQQEETVFDSDSYWEDPADSLLSYHGVTVERMEARKQALSRVLQRLQERKAGETKNEFSADVVVQQLQKDADRRVATATASEHDLYWEEGTTSQSGLVGPANVDSDSYWCEGARDEEEDKQMTAEQLARRHAAILRVQEQCRLRSRLAEFAASSQDKMFSAALQATLTSGESSYWDF